MFRLKEYVVAAVAGMCLLALLLSNWLKRCTRCRGTGHICARCGIAQGSCRCSPMYERCPDCGSIGRL